MGEITKSEIMSRRRALVCLLAATFGLAAPSMLLTASTAEAQTTGTERRQERRMRRTERRQERRMGRTERREERRTGRAERREERRD
jgi:TolA-binding protein